MKTGLLLQPKHFNDWELGGYTPLGGVYINPSGDWTYYLPVVEYQNKGFDRMACVTYAILNAIEILHKYKTGTERNFSDRFVAKGSGTGKKGNYVYKVFDFIRHNGLVSESSYPDVSDNWETYYKELTPELYDEAKNFLKEWSLYREWVDQGDILEALKQAPLPVTVRYASGNGILNPTGAYNHEVLLFNVVENEYYEIFDHYEQVRKKYAWDYQFGSILKPTLTTKTIPMQIKDNYLYQLVEDKGGFALGLDGKLLIDDESKVLASFIVRNNGNIKGKTKAVTLNDWNSVEHFDLKGNKL